MTVFNAVDLSLFICWDAENLQDYSETAYALTLMLGTTFGLEMFELIDNFENVMEKRRLNLPVTNA